MIIGAAAILRYNGRYVFEIQKKAKWERSVDGILRIGVGCIGGSVVSGETPVDTLQREAMEEIGCRVAIDASPAPFLVELGESLKLFSPVEVDIPVLFLWEAFKPGYVKGARVAVFSGCVEGKVESRDLPAVLCLGESDLVRLATGSVTVGDMLAGGGGLIEREHIPREAQLVPVGTVEVLLALGEKRLELLV